ncbi:hypothetical protein G9A89_016063 [Geosiphon pyriformis]|nr:hypothetical protein G9A89_016063 [Geosiphon pyriformis]
MSDYSYLPQQSEEYFETHNKNDLDFIELNLLFSCLICFLIENQFSRQFQDFWNWFLNEHLAETYTAYTTYYFDQPSDFEYLNHQIHIWIAAHQATETSFETKEESYQTAPVFDLLLSELDLSIQTVTSKPMANDLIQANILAALQGIQTALRRRNNTPLPLFRDNAQDPIKWLDDFEKAATANQFDEEYKFQIVGPGEIVTEYAKAIRKLIKHVDSEKNWTEEQKIYSIIKGLKTDLSYAFWPFLVLKDNPTMNMTIKLAQKIEDNQRMHLGSTLSVFAPASAMASVSQMAAASFAAQT